MVMNIGKAPTFGDAEPKLRCGVGSPAIPLRTTHTENLGALLQC